MSLRVDLFPIVLSRLRTGTSERGPGDDLLGRLRALPPEVESERLAAVLCKIAYDLREPSPEVEFDLGSLWNALDRLDRNELPEPENELVAGLVDGRPLFGSRIVSDWSSYAWIEASELTTFEALLERTKADARYDVERLRPWVSAVRAKKLAIFVRIG